MKKDIKITKEDCVKITDWIIKAKLINRAALCEEAGIDKSNFYKFIKMGEMPKHHAKKLISILSFYGYKSF